MQVYTFPYWPSPVAIQHRQTQRHRLHLHYHHISGRRQAVRTDLVAPLPFEGDLPEAHVHDVVERLGRVADLADDVALLHHRVALVLELADGAAHSLHGTLPRCRI